VSRFVPASAEIIAALEQIIQMMAVALSLNQRGKLAKDRVLWGEGCTIILSRIILLPQEGVGINGDLLAFRPLGDQVLIGDRPSVPQTEQTRKYHEDPHAAKKPADAFLAHLVLH